MIHINIEIKKPNRIKDFLHKSHSRLEDVMFSILLKIPERLVPRSIMGWLDRYTTRRINQLEQESIKSTWKNMYLQKAVDDISSRKSH